MLTGRHIAITQYRWRVAFVTGSLAALLLSCTTIANVERCKAISIDSGGTYELRVSTIQYYKLLGVYLASHRYVDAVDIEVPKEEVSALVQSITLSGAGIKDTNELVCEHFPANGETSLNCWQAVHSENKLVIGIRFNGNNRLQIDKDVEAISRYVTRNVM